MMVHPKFKVGDLVRSKHGRGFAALVFEGCPDVLADYFAEAIGAVFLSSLFSSLASSLLVSGSSVFGADFLFICLTIDFPAFPYLVFICLTIGFCGFCDPLFIGGSISLTAIFTDPSITSR